MKLNSKYFDNIRSGQENREHSKTCDNLGCNEPGEYIAKNKNGKTNLYCIEHIRLHNKNYNFFSDMTEDEIIDFQISSITGHRPTWKMGSNHNASKKDFFEFYSNSQFDDPFGFFEEEKNKNNKPYGKGKTDTSLALKELSLKGKPSKKEIQDKFKEIVKSLHPDINGKNKKNEEKLKLVINAYNQLKTSGLC